jgi:hypothetical protein
MCHYPIPRSTHIHAGRPSMPGVVTGHALGDRSCWQWAASGLGVVLALRRVARSLPPGRPPGRLLRSTSHRPSQRERTGRKRSSLPLSVEGCSGTRRRSCTQWVRSAPPRPPREASRPGARGRALSVAARYSSAHARWARAEGERCIVVDGESVGLPRRHSSTGCWWSSPGRAAARGERARLLCRGVVDREAAWPRVLDVGGGVRRGCFRRLG